MIDHIEVIDNLIYVYDSKEKLLFVKDGELISFTTESITVVNKDIVYLYDTKGNFLLCTD